MIKIICIVIFGSLTVTAKSQIIITTLTKSETIKVSQNITINNPALINASIIETSEDLSFDANNVSLSNVQIKAAKILVQNSVASITIVGSVKLVCENFEILPGRVGDLVIKGTESSDLLIQYKKRIAGAKYISEVNANGKLFSLKFEKITK